VNNETGRSGRYIFILKYLIVKWPMRQENYFGLINEHCRISGHKILAKFASLKLLYLYQICFRKRRVHLIEESDLSFLKFQNLWGFFHTIFVITCEIETHGLIVLWTTKVAFVGWRDWKITIVLFQGVGTVWCRKLRSSYHCLKSDTILRPHRGFFSCIPSFRIHPTWFGKLLVKLESIFGSYSIHTSFPGFVPSSWWGNRSCLSSFFLSSIFLLILHDSFWKCETTCAWERSFSGHLAR
jgi:hypothetical protein